MITETNLSRTYSTFWGELAPWLRGYVHSINSGYIERVHAPHQLGDMAEHKAINNVISFDVFMTLCQQKMSIRDEDVPTEYLEVSRIRALEYLKWMPGEALSTYSFSGIDVSAIQCQVKSLLRMYFGRKGMVIAPSFPGCGVVGNCTGDLLYEKCLVEVKAGERSVSSADIRQILIYCALNHYGDNPYEITSVELFNPRQGTVWTEEVGRLTKAISGASPPEVFERICQFVSEEIAST